MNYRKENNTPLSKEEIAAIIGYWRQGASDGYISLLMTVDANMVTDIISDYQSKQEEIVL